MIFSNEELLKIIPSGGPKLAEVQKYIDKYLLVKFIKKIKKYFKYYAEIDMF